MFQQKELIFPKTNAKLSCYKSLNAEKSAPIDLLPEECLNSYIKPNDDKPDCQAI